MIIDLTPDTFFEHVNIEGPLHVVMHYGETCGPCKHTMPHYENVSIHFAEHGITNVKFYRFHQWEEDYRDFIQNNNLKTAGVPTFRYFYMNEIVNEETRSFGDPNELKQHIIDTIRAIEVTMKMEFEYYEG